MANGAPSGADLKLALVVEHPELSEYLAQRIGNNLSVEVFGSAEQALADVDGQRFGLIVSEIRLPGMDGIELCRRIKADPATTDMPVILMTALDSDVETTDIADLCLIKPFSLFTLLEGIDRLWPGGPPQSCTAESVHPVLAVAHEFLDDSTFSVTSWSEKAGLSSQKLTRTVFHVSGMTPTTWLREQRLRRVHRMISNGSCRSLIEAGKRCGFDNPDYLQRVYRVRYGDQ